MGRAMGMATAGMMSSIFATRASGGGFVAAGTAAPATKMPENKDYM